MAAAGAPAAQGLQAKKMFNLVNDKLAAGAARLNGGEYQDVDIAIVKATNHDEVPPKEKHVRTLKEAVSSAPSRRKVIYIVHELYDKLKTSGEDWLVVIKTLMVYHRIMKADDQCTFKMEMGKYMEKRKLTTFLRLDNFSDHSRKETWDYSAWLRAYSLYLDTRLEVYRSVSFDLERDVRSGETKLKTAASRELLDVLPRLQQMMQRVLACVPEGAASTNPVIMEALKWVLSECFRLYRAVSEGVINLADRFFEMDRVDARKALDIYREAINSTDRMQEFFAKIQNMSAGKSLQFPQLAPPPEDFLEQMEAYAKGAPGPGTTTGTVVTRLGTLLTRREDPSSTPLTVTTESNGVNGVNGDGQSEPAEDDLLNFGDLSIEDNAAQQATQSAASTRPTDPFGDSAFRPTAAAGPPQISVRGLPPSLHSPSPASTPTTTPSLIDDWAATNYQSTDSPAPSPAQNDPFVSLNSPSPMPSPGSFPPASPGNHPPGSPGLGFGLDQQNMPPANIAVPPPVPPVAAPSPSGGGYGFNQMQFPAAQISPPSPSAGGNPFTMGGVPSPGPSGYAVVPARPVAQARPAPQPAYQHRVRDPFGDMMSDIIPTKPASPAPGVPMAHSKMPFAASAAGVGAANPMGQSQPHGGNRFGTQPAVSGNPFGENAFPSSGNWT